MQRIGQYFVYLIVRLLLAAVQAVPLAWAESLARFGAWLCWDLLHLRRRVVEENLRHAFPQWSPQRRDQVARAMWHHLLLLVIEVAQAARRIHRTNWHQFVQVEDESQTVAHLLQQRPLLLVTAHFGNFEMAGYLLGLLGYPIHSVARPLDNPYLDRLVESFRGSKSQKVIRKQGEFDRIEQILSSGGILSLLADQYAGRKGCWVQFFGRPASAHKAIALLALEHQAPIAVGYCVRTGRPMHFRLVIQAVLDPKTCPEPMRTVPGITQWYTEQFEQFIRRWPEQYWWVHRRWKDPRKKKRSRSRDRRAA